MRIDPLKLHPAPETPPASSPKTVRKSPDPRSDQASLSDLTAALRPAKEERIEALRAAVAADSYSVSPSGLAASLIDAHLKT